MNWNTDEQKRAEFINSDFQNKIPDVVIVHWDGKLLPELDVTSSIEEWLPILISFGDRKQILAVQKLESCKHQG